MTTQKPEALRLAEILEGDYCPDWFYEQGVDEVGAELRRQHTRIAELEAQLEAIGAGGVSGPLMGRASLAASAGSEPVAWRELCRRLYVELFYCDQQMTSGKRPKWQQGKTVRDVLADAKAALDAAPQTDSQPAVDALAEAEYFIDNPSAWSNFDQRASDAMAAVCKALRAARAPADSVLEDAAFEAVRKQLCALPRYSFVLDDDGLIRRVQDRVGNWIEFDDAHALFDPVAVDAARKQGENHD